MFDVSTLVPEAQPIAFAAAEVYHAHLYPWLLGILVHGSALKGGFIPYCSDIDFHIYLDVSALEADGQLPLPLAMYLQRDLACINPAPFQYIQSYIVSPNFSYQQVSNRVPPIPGTYVMLTGGTLPVPEATAEQVRVGSLQTLERVKAIPARVSHDLLSHGGGRLERSVRLLCTDVWPTLFSILTLQSDDPFAIWSLSKTSAITLLPTDSPLGREIRRFYELTFAYYRSAHTVDSALTFLAQGVRFLTLAQQWYADYLSKNTPTTQ